MSILKAVFENDEHKLDFLAWFRQEGEGLFLQKYPEYNTLSFELNTEQNGQLNQKEIYEAGTDCEEDSIRVEP